MTTRGVRRAVVALCVLGVAGMIAGSVADNTGAALTFGLLSAAAVACLMVATAVGGTSEEGRAVESLVRELVDAGADEGALRRLVRESIRLGQARRGVGAGVHGGRTPGPDAKER